MLLENASADNAEYMLGTWMFDLGGISQELRALLHDFTDAASLSSTEFLQLIMP
jgi:hypothetical protein